MDTVQSSFIRDFGYDELGKRLIVRFKTGSVYEYLDVPRDVYLGLQEAESRGRYYAKHIRGKYKSQRP